MSENQDPTIQKKNALDRSTASAGRDMHIGDVNVTIHQTENAQAWRLNWIVKVAILLLVVLLGWWGYCQFIERGGHSTAKNGGGVIEEKPELPIDKPGSNTSGEIKPGKITESPVATQINNRVAGVVKNPEGAGIPNIQVTANNGRSTKTDANGYFKLDLGGEVQMNHVRLIYKDPNGFYDDGDRNYIVPKNDISMILY